jgi:hypothetical protein
MSIPVNPAWLRSNNLSRFLIVLVMSTAIAPARAQTNNGGEIVFHSVSTGEKTFGDVLLISNYYPLRNNIMNKRSSAFISEKPTLAQIEKAAISLPSDFFVLTKQTKIIATVRLDNKPRREFTVILMPVQDMQVFASSLEGDITENRAKELIQEEYDSTARIEKDILTFNGKKFKIIPEEKIGAAVWALLEKEGINKRPPSEMVLPSKGELREYVLSLMEEGADLDFFTPIKGKENNGIQIKPGVFSTNLGIALYKWGRACYEIGVNTEQDCYEIFTAYKGRELNAREKDYIKMGFYEAVK